MRRAATALLACLFAAAPLAAPGPPPGAGARRGAGHPADRAAQRDHRRPRRAGRADHRHPRRLDPHRRHRDPAARRQPLPGSRAGGGVRHQRIRQAGGHHPARRAGRARDADPADLHPLRLEGGGRDGGLAAGAARDGRGPFHQPRRRGNQRLLPERHPAAPDFGRRRRRRAHHGADRPGGGRQRRRRHRDHHARVEGRHRHLVASGAHGRQHLDGRRAGADQLRRERRAHPDGRAGRPAARTGRRVRRRARRRGPPGRS